MSAAAAAESGKRALPEGFMYVAGAKKRKDGSFPITFVNISDAALRQSSQ